MLDYFNFEIFFCWLFQFWMLLSFQTEELFFHLTCSLWCWCGSHSRHEEGTEKLSFWNEIRKARKQNCRFKMSQRCVKKRRRNFVFEMRQKWLKNQNFLFEMRQRCLKNKMILKWVRHVCLRNKMTLQSECLRHAKTIVFRANKNALKSPLRNCNHKSKEAGRAISEERMLG